MRGRKKEVDERKPAQKKEHDRDRLPGSLELRIINRQGRMIKCMTSVQESLKYSLPRDRCENKEKALGSLHEQGKEWGRGHVHSRSHTYVVMCSSLYT